MAKPDLSEFFTEKPKQCITARMIEKLSPEDKEKVEAALEESSITAAGIVRFLQMRGLDAKHPAVLRHRKRECICV